MSHDVKWVRKHWTESYDRKAEAEVSTMMGPKFSIEELSENGLKSKD